MTPPANDCGVENGAIHCLIVATVQVSQRGGAVSALWMPAACRAAARGAPTAHGDEQQQPANVQPAV